MNGRMQSADGDKHRLTCFLGVFARGVEDDFAPPLIGPAYSNPLADKDLARKQVGDSVWQCCDIDTVPSWLRDAERRAQSKHGSSSRRPPYSLPATVGDSLESQVGKILVRHPVRLNHKAADRADKFVDRMFWSVKGGKLTPCDLKIAATSFDGKTSLGYPRFVSGRHHLADYFQCCWEIGEMGFPLDLARTAPGLIGARSVPRGPYQYAKTRFVTQWSRLLGNWEKAAFTPLFERLVQAALFCAWRGQVGTDICMTEFMGRREGPVLSLDYTGFDATVPFEVISRIFTLIKSWFVGSAAPLIDFIHEGFIGSGLFVPGRYVDGTERLRGIPSGSVLTNLIGSLVNLWVMEYACVLNRAHVQSAFVQGDDGVYTFRGNPSIPSISQTLETELGMIVKMDPTKNLVSKEEVMFLQNHHRLDYVINGLNVGVRPVERALTNMMAHERSPAGRTGWSKCFNTYRTLQQANNACSHPRFEQLCLWLWSRDGYIKEALEKILRSDPEVSAANASLDVGRGERGKLPVRELAWSPVVQRLIAIAGY